MSIFFKHKDYPKLYFKYLPFHLDQKAKHRIRFIGQFSGIIVLTAFIAYVFLNNSVPFGMNVTYNLSDTTNISALGPKKRVSNEIKDGQPIVKQVNDLVYFTTNMPFKFDTATVKFTYQNLNPDQTIAVGFQDQAQWHYATKPFDIPFLNSLSWQRNGEDPVVLYQRETEYQSVKDFMAKPPKDGIIGTYEYDNDLGNTDNVTLLDYHPQTQPTVIDIPLRGKHVLYIYLDHEPFQMSILKQDLNWYEDPDVVNIKIYKNTQVVYQATAPDDGIEDSSHKIAAPQEIKLKNPGPNFPERGVYKIVIDANNDTIIRQITTNAHKIVLAGAVYLAGNNNIYPTVVASTSATTLYTNALSLSAKTYHNSGEQTLLVGDQQLKINSLNTDQFLTPQEAVTQLTIPQNDVILNAFQGYFSLTPDQFFVPTKYHILPITKKDDVKLVDYVLTNYVPPTHTGAWQTQERTFDLSTAYTNKGQLSWVIKAPKLKENNSTFMIKDISITFHKKPWLY